MQTENILSISEYIVSKRPGGQMSKSMLLPVLYFIQKKHYIKYRRPLFLENIEKPASGLVPVIDNFSLYFQGEASVNAEKLKRFKAPLSDKTMSLIDSVIKETENLNSRELINILSEDELWSSTWNGKLVNFERIK